MVLWLGALDYGEGRGFESPTVHPTTEKNVNEQLMFIFSSKGKLKALRKGRGLFRLTRATKLWENLQIWVYELH